MDGKEEEALLQEALAALKKLYQEFGAAFTYGEQAKDPQNHEKLVETIDAFGPMPCRMISLTTERMARMIEDAIAGNLDCRKSICPLLFPADCDTLNRLIRGLALTGIA